MERALWDIFPFQCHFRLPVADILFPSLSPLTLCLPPHKMNCLLLALFVILAVLAQAIAHDLLLRPRTPAPQFKAKAVIDDKFIDVSLSEFTNAGKWVVLLFYPFDYTFVCPVSILYFH